MNFWLFCFAMNELTHILRISYDGTEYFGWQKQPNVPTVQGVIEHSLRKLFGKEIKTVGASRTDRGVHAIDQVVSFVAPKRYEPKDLMRRLNKMLPADIAVWDSIVTEKTFNARFDCEGKIYRYRIFKRKKALEARFGWWYEGELDINLLGGLAELILGEHDFRVFSIQKDLPENPRCTIFEAYWREFEDKLQFFIFGDRFLHKMVRSLVGAMVAVCGKQISDTDFRKMLYEGVRVSEFRNAPPHGLCLLEVKARLP